ncbi:hypothetical protein N658DRAFT_562094 [Parathielavia hyrcaniae]|uniref:Uncharacterized protein n=1 Tax=Parathielavia hyrcaniae TaxID=113614 RepID=A0AAN6SY13_9PEZI|nr:hypothetical protein N658DRAFT_562094 [Parathielavia hyrcaniae]
MAAFDPIEYFGIAGCRDDAIVQHARTQSSSSISLPTVDLPPCTAVGSPAHRPSAHVSYGSGNTGERPSPSPPHAAGNITPEDSVHGFGFDSCDPCSPASPNVSSNSSWGSDPHHPSNSSLSRYVHNPERHEEIAISMSATPTDRPRVTAGYASQKQPNSRHHHRDNHASILRYLEDIQHHERFALDFAQQTHPGPQVTPDPVAAQHTLSTSRSGSSSAKEEDDEDMVMLPEKARECRERRRERAMSQPRLYKALQTRKRRSVSPSQGHRDKTPRLA